MMTQLFSHTNMYRNLSQTFKYSNSGKYKSFYQQHLSVLIQCLHERQMAQIPPVSYIRFFHASPALKRIDIYINDKLIYASLGFMDSNKYLPVKPGRYKIDIYPAGTHDSSLLSSYLELRDQTYSTVSVIESDDHPSLLPILDDPKFISPIAKVRFLHLNSHVPRINVSIKGGKPLFRNLAYKQISDYLSVEPMTGILEITLAENGQIAGEFPNITLKPNEASTLVWINKQLKVV